LKARDNSFNDIKEVQSTGMVPLKLLLLSNNELIKVGIEFKGKLPLKKLLLSASERRFGRRIGRLTEEKDPVIRLIDRSNCNKFVHDKYWKHPCKISPISFVILLFAKFNITKLIGGTIPFI
jgi:hypothetical protein